MYRAVSGNCGKLGVLGNKEEHDYTGVVKNSFKLRVEDSVIYLLSSFWVIEYSLPLSFLGADVFCRGQKMPTWNYEGNSLKIKI